MADKRNNRRSMQLSYVPAVSEAEIKARNPQSPKIAQLVSQMIKKDPNSPSSSPQLVPSHPSADRSKRNSLVLEHVRKTEELLKQEQERSSPAALKKSPSASKSLTPSTSAESIRIQIEKLREAEAQQRQERERDEKANKSENNESQNEHNATSHHTENATAPQTESHPVSTPINNSNEEEEKAREAAARQEKEENERKEREANEKRRQDEEDERSRREAEERRRKHEEEEEEHRKNVEEQVRQERIRLEQEAHEALQASLPTSSPSDSHTPSPATGKVSHAFNWPHGGSDVLISGEFNHWQPSPMHRADNGQWTVTLDGLEKGAHYQFKFVVDGVWKHDHLQLTTTDESGNINNMISVE